MIWALPKFKLYKLFIKSILTTNHERTMNTDTPRTDEWETYCDESYYHLWRVRRKNERGFNDGYHVHNGEEARALVDLLNKLEKKLKEVIDQREKLVEALEEMRYAHTDKAERMTVEALAAVKGENHE
jgi:hypothetical protein